MQEPLSESNFILYCAKNYDTRFCSSTEDFYDDLKLIKYIKKLITRYENTGELKERLILNHIMTFSNLFGPEATCRILYFKLKDQFSIVKPFLVLLRILPEQLYNIDGLVMIDLNEIPMNSSVIEALRKI